MNETISLDTKKEFVQRQTCFSKLTEEENEKLAALLVEKHVAVGETIVTEGDPVDSAYLIVSGSADVRHLYIKNDAIQADSLATLNAGQAIGLNDTGFYSLSGIRTATVVAITEMVLLRLSIAEFHGFSLMYSHVNEIMRQNADEILGPDAKL